MLSREGFQKFDKSHKYLGVGDEVFCTPYTDDEERKLVIKKELSNGRYLAYDNYYDIDVMLDNSIITAYKWNGATA